MTLPNPLTAIEGQITAQVLARQPLILKQLTAAMDPGALQAKVAAQMAGIEHKISAAIAAKIDHCLQELLGGLNIEAMIMKQINEAIDQIMDGTYGC